MDTTPQNCLMVEKAMIQGEWTPQNGDFVWHPNEGAEYMGTWEFPERFDVVHLSDTKTQDWWRNWLWLPRQDQLQSMIGDDTGFRTQINLIDNMLSQCISQIGHGLTWEQLWLRIVMKYNYLKVWNSKEWVHEKN